LHYWRLNEKPALKIDEYNFLYGVPEKKHVIRRFEPSSEMFGIIEMYPSRKKMSISEQFKEAEKYLEEREGAASEL